MIFTLTQIQVFMFVLARVLGLFGQSAFFSLRSIPVIPKAAIGFFVTLVIWFNVPVPAHLPGTAIGFIFALLIEYLIGRLLGFVSFIIVQSILAAGDLMGMQMGLSSATMFDPAHGVQISVMGTFFDYIAMMFFLGVEGHVLLLSALQKSFTLLPVSTMVNFSGAMIPITDLGVILWELSVRLAAPVILTIFLLDFAMGTVSKVAPQVNVFQLGFQVKPVLGLITLYLMMPLLVFQIIQVMNTILEKMIVIMGHLHG